MLFCLRFAVQVNTSAIQRRNERIARMFDVRLELYTKTRRALSDWLEQYRVCSRLKFELETNLKHRKDEFATLTSKAEEILSKEPHSSDAVFGQTATATRETAKRILKEIEDCQASSAEQMQKTQAVASDRLGKLYTARDEIQELSHKVPLLASKPVDEALTEVLDKVLSYTKSIKSDNKLDSNFDFHKFDRAVRKELGVEF